MGRGEEPGRVRLAETEAPLLRLGVCGPAGVVDVAAGAGGGSLCVNQPSRLKASTNCHVLVVPALLVSLVLAVSTGGAPLSGVGRPTLAALLTAPAVCTVYVEPATRIAVPDERCPSWTGCRSPPLTSRATGR